MGFGSGQLHAGLLRIPDLVVDSVDISEDVIRLGLQHFNLHRSVCRSLYMHSDGTFVDTTGNLYQHKPSDIEKAITQGIGKGKGSTAAAAVVNGMGRTAAGHCRSTVIVADAWDYITAANRRAQEAAATAASHHYDFLVFDISDMLTTRWDGNEGTGRSNPDVERASSVGALDAVRSLLTPYRGIAIFHIHRDSQFESYFAQIQRVFGLGQTALFKIKSNDNFVLAARDKFVESEIVRIQQWETDIKQEGESCTLRRCFDAAQGQPGGYAAHPEFRSQAPHPCTDPLQFAQNSVSFAEANHFGVQLVHSHRFSLACDGFPLEEGAA